jgi:hypothetical protein
VGVAGGPVSVGCITSVGFGVMIVGSGVGAASSVGVGISVMVGAIVGVGSTAGVTSSVGVTPCAWACVINKAFGTID